MRKSMAKPRKKPVASQRPSYLIRGYIPPSHQGAWPLPHHLPLQAWAQFFAVAFDRLHRANPGWAALTMHEFREFTTSWEMVVHNREWKDRDQWMTAAFAHIEAQQFGRGHFKGTLDRRRHILMWARKEYRDGLLPLDDPRINPVALPHMREHHRDVERAPVHRRKITYKAARTPLNIYLDAIAPPVKGRPRVTPPAK